MTAKELFDRSLAIINERRSIGEMGDIKDFYENAPQLINTLCSMLWTSDCLIRGISPKAHKYLPSALKSLDEDIYLHPALCDSVMPFGLVYLLLLEEEPERAKIYYSLFREAESRLLSQTASATVHSIIDVYA